MRRLSGLDTAFLSGETPAMHLHGGAITILDPSTAPARFDVDRFREVIAARLDRLDAVPAEPGQPAARGRPAGLG